ncbi:tetratricopeptide repeat protein [Algisphaera agarilytica]|uniref:Tetratricopeptide (TPR) repeat protein n=1 Tax=Algisphaera agarilytica TaxID=1385975 RepID=A0A7X0H385_9BACT|nr:tetratricopeptide repeat protein [Algisphaera agarilytica]MBB6428257.1 tetratricopeptide (TPR) repeat protein [Algisphaera agarilytica]
MGCINANEFLATVTPALNSGDVEALREVVSDQWKPHDLCGLLRHKELDVRRTAVVTLGVTGDVSVVGCLTRCLHDDDEQVHHFAEDALWSIWFRSGKCAAADQFRAGVTALTEDDYPAAIEAFRAAVDQDPAFAEAYNQLAIAHYLSSEWEASVSACRQVLALMPTHFGAMAGLGHCYAHLGQLRQAIDCYRRALAINPRMSPIADAKARLEHQLAKEEEQTGPSCPMTPPHTKLLDFEFDPTDQA